MGRPPLPKAEIKADLIGVRVKPDEAKKIAHAARQSKETPAEYMRQATRERLENPPEWVKSKWTPQELHNQKVWVSFDYVGGAHVERIATILARGNPNGEISVTLALDDYWASHLGIRTFMPLPQEFVDNIKEMPNPGNAKFTLFAPTKSALGNSV